MERILTERQQRVVELASGLAARFAERASEYDRTATFPHENYDDMREAGYLRLTIPEELGGAGASLLELCMAQERLATGCGSTALAVTMHLSPLLQLAEHWRVNPRPELETFLRDVVDGRAIFASLSAEAGFPLVTDSGAIMRRVEGGYRVSGRKIFGTNNAVCTHFSTMARYEDPELGPRIFFFRIRRDAEGLAFHETWDTLGMRGTRSDDWSMEDVFVPDESLIHSFPAGHYDGLQLKTLWCVSMPVFGSVYLGVACGAMEWVREQTLKRGLEGSAETQRSFAEMEVLLETSRAMIRCHAADLEAGHYDQLPVQIGMARAIMVKYVTTNNAVAIVDRVMELAGGMAYFRRFPLERMFRDVRAGLIHPANNFDARELFAKSSLGIEILPAIPIAEAGPNSRPRDSRDGQTSPLAVAASPA